MTEIETIRGSLQEWQGVQAVLEALRDRVDVALERQIARAVNLREIAAVLADISASTSANVIALDNERERLAEIERSQFAEVSP